MSCGFGAFRKGRLFPCPVKGRVNCTAFGVPCRGLHKVQLYLRVATQYNAWALIPGVDRLLEVFGNDLCPFQPKDCVTFRSGKLTRTEPRHLDTQTHWATWFLSLVFSLPQYWTKDIKGSLSGGNEHHLKALAKVWHHHSCTGNASREVTPLSRALLRTP